MFHSYRESRPKKILYDIIAKGGLIEEIGRRGGGEKERGRGKGEGNERV
jgi:hypothetical protein